MPLPRPSGGSSSEVHGLVGTGPCPTCCLGKMVIFGYEMIFMGISWDTSSYNK